MALENRLDLVNSANRRGLLLGLTLSEIMMIILFALLLLFGAIFLEQDEDRLHISRLEQTLADLKVALAESKISSDLVPPLRDTLRQYGIAQQQIENLLKELKIVESLREDIRLLKEETTTLSPAAEQQSKQRLEQTQAELRSKETELAAAERRLMTLNRELADITRKKADAAKLAEAMGEAGISPSQARQADQSLGALRAVMDDLRQRLAKAGTAPDKIDAVIDKAGKDWGTVARDNKTLGEQKKYWENKWAADVGNGKKGVTPCWAPDGVIEYIYDVALYDDGMVIRKNDGLKWAEEGETLEPYVRDITLMQLIHQNEFMTQTRPLFNYSNTKERDCRFFVRLFDETSVTAKLTYQQRRRAVESHFFILDMKSSRF